MTPLRLAVLLSAGGTTFQNLLDVRAAGQLPVEFAVVVANNARAFGLERARQAGVPTVVVPRRAHADVASFSTAIFAACAAARADVVCLAGFLQLLAIPPAWQRKVLNIHPSLLPAFGGAGFYGEKVHAAALARGVKISGCTVHFADNEYDHGPILLQRAVAVEEDDTPTTLAARVFAAECQAYPEALRLLASDRVQWDGPRVRIAPAR
jgi:formyltetrahydrofolate-dependent phosphoribosylglycinamide formyltransferase